MGKKEQREKELLQKVNQLGEEVLNSDRFLSAWDIPHHGNVSVAMHSLHVAKESCRIADWLQRHGVKISDEDAVRSSLLHDIGMTERRVFSSPSWRKAYTHPDRGTEIAEKEYHANEIQKDAIQRHMWPICVIPPSHVAGWVVLALDKMATEAVISTLTKQKEYSKQPNWCNTMNLVFTTEQGRNLCIQTVEKPFKRIVRKLGLSEMRIHDLRHTFATRCLANGDSIMSVSAQLGHSNVSTTVNIYSHTTDEMLKESAHRRSQQNEKLLKSEPEKKTGKVPKTKNRKNNKFYYCKKCCKRDL